MPGWTCRFLLVLAYASVYRLTALWWIRTKWPDIGFAALGSAYR